MAIIVATNSWGPPDAEDYIRMAFGQVAGHTVAVLTALVLLGTSIRLRSRDAIIGWSLIALFVLGTAYSGLQTASERLIQIVG